MKFVLLFNQIAIDKRTVSHFFFSCSFPFSLFFWFTFIFYCNQLFWKHCFGTYFMYICCWLAVSMYRYVLVIFFRYLVVFFSIKRRKALSPNFAFPPSKMLFMVDTARVLGGLTIYIWNSTCVTERPCICAIHLSYYAAARFPFIWNQAFSPLFLWWDFFFF